LTGVIDNNNRLNGIGFTTDAAGNLIADSVHTFTFDAENHLLSTAQTGQTTVSYKYDGDGKRVQKSSGTLYWYGLNNEPLLETTLTGSPSFAYYYFNGRITNRRPWYHFWNTDTYVSDALGNTSLVGGLTPAGAGTWDYSDYYPYGGEWAHQSGIGNHYKFTGKERDLESGDDNFLARFYTSNLGRFTSPDDSDASDSGNPQALNLYSYVQNNPVNATDPDGHDCVFTSGNYAYVARGDCKGIANGVYVAGTVDVKSGYYDRENHTLSVSYTPYDGGSLGKAVIGNNYPRDASPTEFEKFASRMAVGADNVNAFALHTSLQAGAAGVGRAMGLGVEAIQAARAAKAAAQVSEIAGLLAKATGTVGNAGAVASSKEIALAAAEEWVGPGAKTIVDRSTGQVVGKISASGDKVYRVSSITKAQPYVNLENKLSGGNLHVRF
jgi:RHS repeat-associated protein